jgi:hypothetical protein
MLGVGGRFGEYFSAKRNFGWSLSARWVFSGMAYYDPHPDMQTAL